MTPEDDMIELTSMKQEEDETLREFIKRFHRVVLDLRSLQPSPSIQGTDRKGKDTTPVVQFEKSSHSVILYHLRAGQERHRD